MVEVIQTDVLIVGGGTGGVAAAVQAARRGANTVLVSEFGWLGGMLTTAGVVAPDGNELLVWQTGIWGAFLRELQVRQGSLDHAWVSFFTYEPRVGAAIFADWVEALPNLRWIKERTPLEVRKQADRPVAVRFADCWVEAKLILDATELGDLLALSEIPHRWGWEWHSLWQEPSAPVHPSTMTQTYAVQAPTWVFMLEEASFEADRGLLESVAPAHLDEIFGNTWQGFGAEAFLNYGRLPGNRFMINWPEQGNDYGLGAERLIASESARQEFLQEAFAYACDYALFLQRRLDQQLGKQYRLAADTFPASRNGLGGGAFALYPYYRESRRLQGITTVCEQDILPKMGGRVAALPLDADGRVNAIAIGNYANDHHYPGFRLPLHPKSIRWGGRWTGTPFALPYDCLIPAAIDGLLVCEKNISVSHIANGATRLQPMVLGIGQAAGMAAALCIEQNCQPRELAIRSLQNALLQDPTAPLAVVPLFNLPPMHPEWQQWQQYYLDHPDQYPLEGYAPLKQAERLAKPQSGKPTSQQFTGIFQRRAEQDYCFQIELPESLSDELFSLVTLDAEVDQQLQSFVTDQKLRVTGRLNRSGNWLLVEAVSLVEAISKET